MRNKMSNRKVDLANQTMKKDAEPLDNMAIVLDAKKVENLTKALPKIKKIKKEKVEVGKSVTTVSTDGTRTQSLDQPKIDPSSFLNQSENDTEKQVKSRESSSDPNGSRLRISKIQSSLRLCQIYLNRIRLCFLRSRK